MSTRLAKRPRTDHSLVNVWGRELGLFPNRYFSNRFSASEHLLRQLGLDRKLRKHKGCVNTVSFNADGDILLSGSDDRQVILWNWETASVKLSFDSAHSNNIFQAKFMPFSEDRSIVTSAADGYRSEGWYYFAQPVDHFCPDHLIGNDRVGITGLAFSDQSELLASYSDEFIYLFSPDMGLGPNPSSTETEERSTPQVYKEHKNRETVKGVNFFGPKCEYVVSGSDCGRIFIWRKDGELLRAIEADKHVVNCVESHPHMPLLCSSGIETDIKIWTPGGTETLGNAKEASVSGNPRRFLFYDEEGDDHAFNPHRFYVDGDDERDADSDSDDENSDESSDDDDSVEEEENGEVEDDDGDDVEGRG